MWPSNRVDSVGLKHSVASSSKVASAIGLHVLKEMGGTAADAAVAMAAVLNVTQPHTCGIGGDIWTLYYENKSKKVYCLCGQGKSPENFTPETMSRLGFDQNLPLSHHPICVGVPGAPAALCDLQAKFGRTEKIPLSKLFRPAVDLARDGFVVEFTSASNWRDGVKILEKENFKLSDDFLINGQPPKCGQAMRNLNLAKTYENLGIFGKQYFYDGQLTKSIVDCVQKSGGILTEIDLRAHETEFLDPISVNYTSLKNGQTVKVWETPMTSQGVVTLEALKILEHLQKNSTGEPDGLLSLSKPDNCTHLLVEIVRICFADLANQWKEAEFGKTPSVDWLLSSQNVARKAGLFDPSRPVNPQVFAGGFSGPENFPSRGDTTYLCTADRWGNSCSMVFSNYQCFGTSLIPDGCGFTLNNRLKHFWEFMYRKFAPRTRPFATIMAGLVTTAGDQSATTEGGTDEFLASFGVMGGQAQPQAHLQVLLNLIEFGLSPQESMDKNRFFMEYDFYTHAYKLFIEDSPSSILIGRNLMNAMGHSNVVYPVKGFARRIFGVGNVITKNSWWDHKKLYAQNFGPQDFGPHFGPQNFGPQNLDPTQIPIYWAGSDCRGDGEALCF